MKQKQKLTALNIKGANLIATFRGNNHFMLALEHLALGYAELRERADNTSRLLRLFESDHTERKLTINFEAITKQEWRVIAALASCILPKFNLCLGVPISGSLFAEALSNYTTGNIHDPTMICDCVFVNEGTILDYAHRIKLTRTIATALFCLNPSPPNWLTPIFQLKMKKKEEGPD